MNASPDHAEARLLLACARTRMDSPSIATLRTLLDGPIDWRAVITLATRHRVRPLLYNSLAAVGGDSVPRPILEELRTFASGNAHLNLFLIGELFRLLDLFHSHGIPVAPFKGPMLATSYYGGAALREAGDLDLLVHRRDIVCAKRLLVDDGLHPVFPTANPQQARYLESLMGDREAWYLTHHCEHHLVRPRGETNVDLHWALALREFAVPLREKELWSWLRPRRLAGREVLGFGDEEMLIVLCINGAKDCWARLDRVCDIAELLRAAPQLNWPRVFDRAAGIGCLRVVHLGLQLAADLLQSQLPSTAVRHLLRDLAVARLGSRFERELWKESCGEVEGAGVVKSLFHLAMRERVRDRFAYCIGHLEPTVGDWTALRLPGPLWFLHYLIRPLRLAWRLNPLYHAAST